MLPFEMFIFEKPRSRQMRDKQKRSDWRTRIREEAIAQGGGAAGPAQGPIRVRIGYYFRSVSLDVDNILKAILDGLERVVYESDNDITDLIVSKRSLDDIARNENTSAQFMRALQRNQDFLHIIIDRSVVVEVLQ